MGLILLSGTDAGGQIQTVRIGQGGDSWASVELVAAGAQVASDSLRPAGFTPENNIISAVRWSDVGTGPDEFIPEGGARVWARVADGQENGILVDGNPTTSTGTRFQIPGQSQEGRIFIFDLGASFPVERIAFFPNPEDPTAFLRAYEVRVSDGRSFGVDERPIWETLARVESSNEVRSEIQFPRQLVRYIRLETLEPNPFDIAEIEVFGRGFVTRAQFVSDFIDFTGESVRNFGSLRGSATRVSTEPDAVSDDPVQAVFQVRAGTDTSPESFFQVDLETGSETEVSEKAYDNLIDRERTTRYDAANWSAWSNPVTIDSTGIFEISLDFLPMPRPFFQFRFLFEGTATDVIRIDDLEFTHSRPLAQETRAEVALLGDPFPETGVASVETGRSATFEYALSADLSGNEGFDGLRIATPGRAQLESVSLGEDRLPVEAQVSYEDDGMDLFFPSNRITASDNATIFVRFTATPLLYTTLFQGWLLDSSGAVPQRVAPGDATNLLGTNSVVVFGSLGEPLGRFGLNSAVVTPNGDGQNDDLSVQYDLIFLVDAAQVTISVHDLSGRLVHTLLQQEQAAGSYQATWTEAHELPPGHYIVRLRVETQTEAFERIRIVAVPY
mgnify:CR=1 FL=1